MSFPSRIDPCASPPPRRPLRRRSTCKGSYLQPGGEREWKVERENISALSAIFFHKWLRATAANHGWKRSPFTITGQRTVAPVGRGSSLSAAPQMPPGRKPSIRRACSAPSNLQSTIHTGRVGGEGRRGAVSRRENDRQIETDADTIPSSRRIRPRRSTSAQECVRSPCFLFAKCLLLWCCLWHTADTGQQQQQQQCGDRQRQRGGGGEGGEHWRYNVSAVTVWARHSRAEQSWAELSWAEGCSLHKHYTVA